MKFIIVTGLSGAGKSEAVKALEDLGYFCVDNLPPTLIPKFAEACVQGEGKIEKVALVSDIRGGSFFDSLFQSLNYLKDKNYNYEILFLDASDEILVKRFKETRRRHPLALDGRIITGIGNERNRLREVRDRADSIIDTSKLAPRDLRDKINELYGDNKHIQTSISITVLSFGFKYGIPVDADLVFDVRFIENPFYIPELKKFSGLDEPVKLYVMENQETKKFMDKLIDMLKFLIPNYIKEGKRQLIIAIGCTGGRHRSVAIAGALRGELIKIGYSAGIEHRDISEDVNRGASKL